MRMTIIHNPLSGVISNQTKADIIDLFREAGFQPDYFLTNTLEDLDNALDQAGDLFIVAGGDGSVREAGIHLVDRNIPLSILPLGTANNIGNALGIQADLKAIIAGLHNPTKVSFDIGLVQTPWGKECFLETAGYGIFAGSLANYGLEKGKNLFRAIEAFVRTIRTIQSKNYRVWLDGEDISGEFFMVEAFNIHSLGPRHQISAVCRPKRWIAGCCRCQ